MPDSEAKHVFVSYVREDSSEVDGLCGVLEAAGIPYWRDRKDLGPGDAWRAKIRSAIRGGSLVFLACFSDNSRAKEKSYMNEELTLAIEEYRQMPPGRTWLIPVRFDAGNVPQWDLGAGRVLSDLNYSDLFGKDHMAHVASLVTTINRLLGETRPDAATALAAVEQAGAANRVDLMKRLTKEMLLEPSRRIELDYLVSQEVQRVLTALKDSSRVAGPLSGTNEEQVVRLAEEATQLFRLAEPFCASLQVAVRWGTPETLTPWATGLRTFVAEATKIEGGVQSLVEMRHIPGMVAAMTAGIAAVSSGTWQNLKALVVDQFVKDRYREGQLPLIEATDPYAAFGSTNNIVTNTLARAALLDKEFADAFGDFAEQKNGNYHTPIAEWLHHVLRSVFADQWPDDEAFGAEFDRAEVALGLLAQDAANVRADANPDRPRWARSRWFGRSLWRSQHNHGNPIEDFAGELQTQGAQWAPVRAGLFGGDQARAQSAIDQYRETFREASHGMW